MAEVGHFNTGIYGDWFPSGHSLWPQEERYFSPLRLTVVMLPLNQWAEMGSSSLQPELTDGWSVFLNS